MLAMAHINVQLVMLRRKLVVQRVDVVNALACAPRDITLMMPSYLKYNSMLQLWILVPTSGTLTGVQARLATLTSLAMSTI